MSLSFWNLAILVAVILFVLHYNNRENLRIHGDLTLRGDPVTAPSCGSTGWFPFNMGTSCPQERRTMTIGN